MAGGLAESVWRRRYRPPPPAGRRVSQDSFRQTAAVRLGDVGAWPEVNCFRRRNFWTLPDAVSGKASVNTQWRGVLWAAATCSPVAVGRAHDGHVGDRQVGVQGLLDLPGVDHDLDVGWGGPACGRGAVYRVLGCGQEYGSGRPRMRPCSRETAGWAMAAPI